MITGETCMKRTMRDRCQILTRQSADESPEPTILWDSGAEMVCRVDRTGWKTGEYENGQVPTETVFIRLPVGTVITKQDRVKVTEMFGRYVSPETYAVIGAPVITPDCVSVFAELITGQNTK